MITTIVRFKLPEGTSCADATAMFEGTAPKYRGLPGLVRKYYLYGDDRVAGGVYLWESREAAEEVFSDEWCKMLTERYGTPPEILYFETPVIVDNASGEAIVDAA